MKIVNLIAGLGIFALAVLVLTAPYFGSSSKQSGQLDANNRTVAKLWSAHAVYSTPEQIAAGIRENEFSNQDLKKCVSLLNHQVEKGGSLKTVRDQIKQISKNWPKQRDFHMLLFDVDVQLKDYQAASHEVMPFVKQISDIEVLLKACLVAAATGSMTDEQINLLRANLPYRGEEVDHLWPKTLTASEAEAICAFELGSLNPRGNDVNFYWDLARSLAPHEPIFAEWMGNSLLFNGKREQAFAILDDAVGRTQGLLHRRILSQRNEVAVLLGRPTLPESNYDYISRRQENRGGSNR